MTRLQIYRYDPIKCIIDDGAVKGCPGVAGCGRLVRNAEGK